MEISPDALVFSSPFNEQLVKPLSLKNTTTTKLAFKIKTTAPKLYSVRPNASVVEPGQSVEVAITRQARDPPHPDEKSKDKFLILSMPVGDVDASADFAALWSHLEENFKDQIQNKKIRVHYQFHNPDNQTSAIAEPAGAGPARVHAAGNDELSAAAAVAGAAAGVAASTGGDESFAEKSMNEYGTPLKHAPAQPARYDQAPVSSPSTPAPGPGRSTSSKTSSTSSGLTSRSADKSTTSSSTASNSNNTNTATAVRSRQAASGVPIHIVVALALLAFFIGWKFF